MTKPTIYAGYAYSPRQGALTVARDHTVLSGWFRLGQLQRKAGDALCKPRKRFWGLEDTRDGREATCPTCLERMARYGLEYGPPEKY